MVKSIHNSIGHHNWTAWVGTDEAGKGDYFGSLTVAGVYVDAEIREILHALGVRDGKQLSDSRVRKLAQEMRLHCGDNISQFSLEPTRYNEQYTVFRKHGRNLNHLLASLHAEVIHDLLKHVDCPHILVDRFAKEEVLETELQVALNPHIKLLQMPKAESDIAVAAASIIARDIFLRQLEQLSNKYHIQLPKGASQVIDAGKRFVKQHGADSLRHVAKLHFRTTTDILGDEQ
jgi:ribonuclease HIII